MHISTNSTARSFLRGMVASPVSWQRQHWVLAGIIVLVTVTVGAIIPTGANATRNSDPGAQLVTLEIPVPTLDDENTAAQAEDNAQTDPSISGEWKIVSVRPGQNLGDIFKQQGLNAGDLQLLLGDKDNATSLRSIHPGDEFAFDRGIDGKLHGVRFDRDEHTRVIVAFGVKGMRQKIVDRAIERRTRVAYGVVDRSLFESGAHAGMSDSMVLKLASAFGYDIDFAQDLRQDDSFTVVYDEVYREGERLHDGNIIAATFINRGKRFSAFRYTDSTGNTMYYSEDGRPLRKEFLRTPVEFTRISSLFSVGRMHPVLGYMRAHQGVDYAAPTGTPIHSAGDGKVSFRGWQNGYGNVVIVQHGGHYSTLYGHMSRLGAIKVGQRVSQGQTIGFVGMTGMATGPHLHYEFRVDGVHRNPLTVTLPKPEPLPNVELARFRSQAQPQLAKLKTLEATQLASTK